MICNKWTVDLHGFFYSFYNLKGNSNLSYISYWLFSSLDLCRMLHGGCEGKKCHVIYIFFKGKKEEDRKVSHEWVEIKK